MQRLATVFVLCSSAWSLAAHPVAAAAPFPSGKFTCTADADDAPLGQDAKRVDVSGMHFEVTVSALKVDKQLVPYLQGSGTSGRMDAFDKLTSWKFSGVPTWVSSSESSDFVLSVYFGRNGESVRLMMSNPDAPTFKFGVFLFTCKKG